MSLSKSLVFNVERNEPEMVGALGKSHQLNREIKPLSDIDDQEGLRFLIPVILFYPPSVEGGTIDPVSTIRDGLARALETYYPLAGRIFEGPNRKLIIDCNNEGIMFVEARANVKLEQLGCEIFPPCPHSEKLLCDIPTHGGLIASPLLYFQVTRFICGGFCLGIVVNHTILDGYGLKLFLSAICDLVKGASTPSIPPVWQRELLNARSPPRITCIHNEYDEKILSNTPLVYPEETFIRTSVFFGPKEIQALRKQLPASQVTSFSSFDMITACLWKCRTIALEPHSNDIVRVSVISNARNIKEANIPEGYYGNAFAYPAAVSKADILCASPLAYAVGLVQRARFEMSFDYIKSVADLMVIRGRPKYSDSWNFIVSDLRKIDVDKMDLGWGKPLFGGVAWSSPVISFYSNMKNDKGESGVVVPMSLPSLALERFQNELLKVTHQLRTKL